MSRTKSQAVLGGYCPKCRKGKLFKYPFSRIFKYSKTNEYCPVCGLRFEREPGFFFGAMYISYAITVALLVANGVAITVLVRDASMLAYIIPTIVITLVLSPVNYRISRILFLHWAGGVKFDEKYQD